MGRLEVQCLPGLKREFKASLGNLARFFLTLRSQRESGDVSQQHRACLACMGL